MMNAHGGHDNVYSQYFMSLYLNYSFSDFLFVEAEHSNLRRKNRNSLNSFLPWGNLEAIHINSRITSRFVINAKK